MQTIDTRGHLCPAPLIMTKKAIKASAMGEQFTVITDNETARQNLLSFLSEMGLATNCVRRGDEFHITFSNDGKPVSEAEMPAVEDFCRTGAPRSNYVVAISSDKMGNGDDTLGTMLIRACINSLAELDNIPRTIVIYNGGVLLATRDKDTSASLEKLAGMGVDIIVCGACVDYFNIKDQLTPCVTVSNMYKINSVLTSASSVIYP